MARRCLARIKDRDGKTNRAKKNKSLHGNDKALIGQMCASLSALPNKIPSDTSSCSSFHLHLHPTRVQFGDGVRFCRETETDER